MNIDRTLAAINEAFPAEEETGVRKSLARYAKAMARNIENGLPCDLLKFGPDMHFTAAKTTKLQAINAIFLEETSKDEGKEVAP